VRNFQRSLRQKRFESALSILAHAKHSSTYRSMLAQLKAAVGFQREQRRRQGLALERSGAPDGCTGTHFFR